ncbi:MAG: D-alanyl-D-alanine carboxypeptidase family protein [Gammaproteobacteria bacterium]|nr:D-alanyl-D-alanine carboxypeptidase family protein [Gammaproteobacteria bacterium]
MMKRRHFLVSLGLASTVGLPWTVQKLFESANNSFSEVKIESQDRNQYGHIVDGMVVKKDRLDQNIKDQMYRVAHFDEDFAEDIFLADEDMAVLTLTVSRMRKLQELVGHGNFCMLGFDEMLHHARNYSTVEAFSKAEQDFLERIYFQDAKEYGFMGKKLISSLTMTINKAEGVKISGSGNFLFKGKPLETYNRLKKDIGGKLILTSGIRSTVKQMYLFLAKAEESKGNLSKASRSLAPPGHSYHALGDFDVGNINMGEMNFTAAFSKTKEFEQLVKLGYISIRYTRDNTIGVRYEPWHIKVV